MTLASPRANRGAALFAVLIVLLLVSLMVLLSLRTSLLQERMTAGSRDRAMALQNAESSLAQAQQQLADPATAAGHAGRACSTPAAASDPLCMPHPSLAGLAAPGRAWTPTPDLQPDGLGAGQPAYALQYLGRRDTRIALGLEDEPNYGEASGRVEAEFYRVVARGSDPQAVPERAQVLLQATVVRE